MIKKAITFLVSASISFLVIILIANFWIVNSTSPRLYSDIEALPNFKVGLVLGTSKYVVGGGVNDFWENRMQAATDLYKAGKIMHIIVSGDNRKANYNEPQKMHQKLVELGVPAISITMDFAGLRTLDSIVRCKEVFDQDSVIIITQPFHNHRALFISDFYEIDAVGYSAADSDSNGRYMVYLREYMARFLAVVDLYILNTEPKFLGEKEPLNI
ncbi:MAG: ElyC/SanA/YdcF family protein [Cyclobacteriaceae bacterium]